MITRFKNGLKGFRLGWYRNPPVAGRSWQPAWLPPGYYCHQETNVHLHVPAERGELFLAYNTGTTELETLNWLHATICLTKAGCILETGAADGLGTIALASACRDNGFGKVHSVELDPAVCEKLSATLKKQRLADYCDVHCSDSMAFLQKTNLIFDFGFFDSTCEIRAEEYRICRDRGILKGIAAFHDTSPYRSQSPGVLPPESVHGEFRRKIHEDARDPRNAGFFENTLSRGLFVIYPRPPV
jgi:predicted O-methyltransferase YrrM